MGNQINYGTASNARQYSASPPSAVHAKATTKIPRRERYDAGNNHQPNQPPKTIDLRRSFEATAINASGSCLTERRLSDNLSPELGGAVCLSRVFLEALKRE